MPESLNYVPKEVQAAQNSTPISRVHELARTYMDQVDTDSLSRLKNYQTSALQAARDEEEALQRSIKECGVDL